MICIYCKSKKIVKFGFKCGKQRYLCKNCFKTFIIERAFYKMRYKAEIISMVLELYYKGVSLRNIQTFLKRFFGYKKIGLATIWRWIVKYSELIKKYTDKFKPKLSNTWHTDETTIVIKGINRKGKAVLPWIWSLLDNKNRFLISAHLSIGKERKEFEDLLKNLKTKKKPKYIITDGFLAYKAPIRNILGKDVKQIVAMGGFKTPPTNNIEERFNGIIKDRLKPMRGFSKFYSAEIFLKGFFVYYNFIKPHSFLNGLTPAQSAGIDLNLGDNPMFELIRKASNHSALLNK